jgi:hypothetical protein
MAGTGEIKCPGRTTTSTAALQFDSGVSRGRGRNLDQKSPGPPGWGLMQQASPLLIKKKGKLLKSPLEILWIDTTYDDISYVRGLYD